MARSVARRQRTEPIRPATTPVTALIMSIPVILIVFAGQKYLIEGITLTGIKG